MMETMEFVKIYDIVMDWSNMALDKDFEYKRTIMLDEGFYMDFDINDRPVAFEMMMTAKRFRMFTDRFSDVENEGMIQITRDTIRFVMEVPSNSRSFEFDIPNTHGISPGKFRYVTGANVVEYD